MVRTEMVGFDLTAIKEGEMDSCLKSMVDLYGGSYRSHGEYSAFSKSEEEIPNLEIFAQTLATLKDAVDVEMRICGKFLPITEKEVEEATEDLVIEGQFVLLEGFLGSNAEEWLRDMNFAVKTMHGLVAIAQNESALPEANLMYAMYAAYLNLPIETWAIVTKEDG